ncbi:MAG: hypothetical protein OXB88_10395 [Bacteriovoracales bacterium]|nr:hypothetical protein [Bacteriovoracales bacterium]
MSSKPNKERFTLNFKKNPVVEIHEVHAFLDRLNDKKYGRKITLHEVVADCMTHYGQREIKRIQKASYSPMDRVKIKYDREMKKEGHGIGLEDYLAKKLGVAK